MKVKSLETIKANFKNSISEANRRYGTETAKTTGVIEAAKAGQANYEAQMTNISVLKRRAAGLDKVTDADWQKGIATKGISRHSQGMNASVDKQANNFAPFKSALEGTTLTPRSIDPRANLKRVAEVQEVMLKTAGKS